MERGPWKAERDHRGWTIREWKDDEWTLFGTFPCADDATDVCVRLNVAQWGEAYPHLPGER